MPFLLSPPTSQYLDRQTYTLKYLWKQFEVPEGFCTTIQQARVSRPHGSADKHPHEMSTFASGICHIHTKSYSTQSYVRTYVRTRYIYIFRQGNFPVCARIELIPMVSKHPHQYSPLHRTPHISYDISLRSCFSIAINLSSIMQTHTKYAWDTRHCPPLLAYTQRDPLLGNGGHLNGPSPFKW